MSRLPQITLVEEMRQRLEDAYFTHLEDNQVEFLEYNPVGDNQFEPIVKPEFLLSDDAMARELSYYDFAHFIQVELLHEGVVQPQWVTDWGRKILEEQQFFLREQEGLAVNYN